jgi:sulfate transport system ATP-binding protein
MEIADAVVLMNAGHIEQSGTPHDLYDAPVSPFALQFLGPANEIAAEDGVRYVRPHELRLHDAPVPRARVARVTRVLRLGSRVRYDVALEGGVTIEVDEPAHGPLRALGEQVHVAPVRERRFAEAAP